MSRFRSLNALKSYMSAQIRDRPDGDGDADASRPAPFVTISRQTGAGGRTTADALAGLLNEKLAPPDGSDWTIFDRNLLEVVVEEHEIPEEYMKYMEEQVYPSLQRAVAELLNFHPSVMRLVAKTCRTLLHLATMGNAILVGRGANIVTRDTPVGLHLRLVGSREKRIERAMGYYGLSLKTAQSHVEKEDEGRRHYVKSHFSADIDDPTLYDLVLNTDRTPPDQAARIAAEALAIKWEAVAK